MIEFVYDKGIMPKLTKHISNKSMSELVALFICYEPFQYEEEKPEYVHTKIEVIESLVNTLIEKDDIDNSTNASNTLCEIISRSETIVDGKEIANKIASEEVLNALMMKLHQKNNTALLNVCNVLLFAVEYLNPARANRNIPLPYKFQKQPKDLDAHPLINSIFQNLEIFTEVFGEDNKQPKMQTAFGTSVKPVGLGKIKLIELTEKIIKLNNKKISKKIQEIGLIKLITDLFISSPWNNMLHHAYEGLVVLILAKSDPSLLKSLFEDTSILQIVMDIIKEADFELPNKGKKVRKGYLGHTIKIANHINQYGENIPEVKEYLNKNPEWQSFVLTSLQSINDASNTEIGGPHPKDTLPKREYIPKNGLTDEIEGENYPFGSINSSLLQNSNRIPFGTKVDELESPSTNLQTTQMERAPKLPVSNVPSYQPKTPNLMIEYSKDSPYPSNAPSLNETDKSLEPKGSISEFKDSLTEVEAPKDKISYTSITIRAATPIVDNENSLEYLEQNKDEFVDEVPLKHAKSHEESKIGNLESVESSPGQSIKMEESFTTKREKRKLTLFKKTFPLSASMATSSSQQETARSSLDGTNRSSTKVKIKIKKTDTMDGMKVLEALNKYNILDPNDQSFSLQQYSATANTSNPT